MSGCVMTEVQIRITNEHNGFVYQHVLLNIYIALNPIGVGW
jgi:hypothetical protein